MAVVTISHWGADIETDIDDLFVDPLWSHTQIALANAFTEIEKHDLQVASANIIRKKNSLVIHVKSRPGRKNRVMKASHKIGCCPDCSAPQILGKLHPANGCPYEVIDHVMST